METNQRHDLLTKTEDRSAESAARHIVRGWKDEAYQAGLGWGERSLLPENPAGQLLITDAELDGGDFDGGDFDARNAAWDDKSLVGCNSLIFHCPGTLGTLCSFWGCPSSDWIGCSLLGCPTEHISEC